jgi:hypothetical protein
MRFQIGEWEFNDFVLTIPDENDNYRFLELLSKQPRLDQLQIVEFNPEAERLANISMAERFDAARGRIGKQQVFKGGAQDSTGMVDGPKDGSAVARQQLLAEQAETDRLEKLRIQNEAAQLAADKAKRDEFMAEQAEKERLAKEEASAAAAEQAAKDEAAKKAAAGIIASKK